MAKIIIVNKEARIRRIGIGYSQRDGVTHEALVVRLIPGVNLVDEEEWAKAMKNKVVLANVDAGKIEVGAKVKSNISPLADMTPSRAKRLIADTNDATMLRSWISKEKRDEVIKAAREKITKLESPIQAGRGE